MASSPSSPRGYDSDLTDEQWRPDDWWATPARRSKFSSIVRKREGQRTFEVLPRRWVVERTLSWISRCRRLAHDYERLPEHSEAMVTWAMIGQMARRLAAAPGRRPWERAKAS